VRTKALVVAACLALAGCASVQRAAGPGPRDRDGELLVYLDPFPRGAERLAFTVEAILAVAPDGTAAPLQVALPELSAAKVRSQRLLASGRLPPDAYAGLLVKVKRATLQQEDGASDLAVPQEPVRIDFAFAVAQRRATVLWLRFDASASVQQRVRFAPAFGAAAPDAMVPELSGFCSNSGDHDVTVFDTKTHRVVGVLPVGRRPSGIALDLVRRRLYVALTGEDAVAIHDLQTLEELGRILLHPGDGPRDLALSLDGRSLLVVNEDVGSVSFLDPDAGVEVSRVPAGQDPFSLLLDRAGQRAYVFDRAGAKILVLDVPNRAVVTAIPTEPEPLRGKLNRAGNRLYVVQTGSQYLSVFSVPDFAPLSRVLVGMGERALELDPRTDFVYVGGRTDALRVYEPASLMPMARVSVPGPVTRGDIDDVEDVLFTVVPSLRLVAANELVSGNRVAPIDVGNDPYQVVVARSRR
jgi:YVTN family beta-propeller protein